MNRREEIEFTLALRLLAKAIYRLKQLDPKVAEEMLAECSKFGFDINIVKPDTK